jgi:hypothetical protein
VSPSLHRSPWLVSLLVATSSLLSARGATAADTKSECIDAHERAQSQRHNGHLRAARASLLVCTRAVCPAVIQKECGPWLEQVEAEEPSIVLAVRDATGADVTNVRVSEGGEPLVDRLDGRQIELDPGDHTLRIELPGGSAVNRRMTLREGEKRRQVTVDFSAGRAAPSPGAVVPESRSSPTNTIVGSIAAVVGLGALGTGIAFGVAQNSAASNAHAACPAGCAAGSPAVATAEADLHSAKSERVGEGVSFGVAGAVLGAAAYVLFAHPFSSSAPPAPSATVGLEASAHGATMRLGFAF